MEPEELLEEDQEEAPFEEEEPEVVKKPAKKGKPGRKSKKDSEDDVVDLSNYFWGLGTDIVPTGIYALDIVLGGGYEPGDWIEIAGGWGCGKSTLVLDICRKAYEQGKKIAYLDVENGVKGSILENLGIDVSNVGQRAGKDPFLLISPQDFKELEDVFKIIVSGAKNLRYDIVVVDSLSNVSQFDENLSVTTNDIARRARQEGIFFSEFKSELRRNKITVIVVNQKTTKMEKKGSLLLTWDESTGGNKAKHNFDIRLWMEKVGGQAGFIKRPEETITGSHRGSKGARDDTQTIYGCHSVLIAKKNRSERPEIPVDIHVIFGQGISNPRFVRTVLFYKGYLTGTDNSWCFQEIPELPCVSGIKGSKELNLLELIKENEGDIVEFLKSKNQWKLTSGKESKSSGDITI